jgi:choline kinase
VTDEQVAEVLEEVIEDEPVTDKQVEQILETLSEAAPEQIVAAITQVLAADITSDQATEIASSPEVLAAITETQAEELFEQIVVEELSDTQLEAFTEAIQEAPTEIKEAFEKTIDIFSSQFENYVPTGSNIPVKTRRTLVAVGALIAAIPPTRIRR